jgi:hypothetical protein
MKERVHDGLREHGDGERFYVVVMQELTIYGHTTDQHTQAKYPEDWPRTLEGRAQGTEFGCWHSQWCPDGELGYQDARGLREITHAEFMEADENDWPEQLDSPLTQEGPVIAVGYVDDDGKAVMTWDSIHGDHEETKQ